MLRSTVILILFCSCSCLGSPNSHNAYQIQISVDQLQGCVLNDRTSSPAIAAKQVRPKRQTGWSVQTYYDESTRCLMRCSNELREAVEPFKNEESAATGPDRIAKTNLNFTRLNEACDAMRPPLRCFDQCPQSTLKSSLQPSLEPIRYVCVEKFEDFRANFRCMRKLDPTAVVQCSPGCRRFESAVNRTRQFNAQPYLRYVYSSAEIREMLSGTCSYVQCFTDCSVRLTREACGAVAAELTSGTIQKVFVSLENTFRMTSGGDVMPESCRRLARPGEIGIAEAELPPAPPAIPAEDDQDEPIVSDRGNQNWRLAVDDARPIVRDRGNQNQDEAIDDDWIDRASNNRQRIIVIAVAQGDDRSSEES